MHRSKAANIGDTHATTTGVPLAVAPDLDGQVLETSGPQTLPRIDTAVVSFTATEQEFPVTLGGDARTWHVSWPLLEYGPSSVSVSAMLITAPLEPTQAPGLCTRLGAGASGLVVNWTLEEARFCEIVV